MSKNVPKLRFKEFAGEWEVKELGDLCELITKGTSPKKYDETGNVNFIKIESIKNGSIELDKCSKISTAVHEGELRRSILNKGDILYGIAGSLGTTALVGEEHIPANTNQALAILRGKRELNRDYVMQVLNSVASKRFIYENVSVGAQPNLNLEQMASFMIPYPATLEQTQIAGFFSALDSRITNQSSKLDSLQELKKGVMQKIFSQEIRFKKEDGGEYPEWEKFALSEVGDIITGTTPSTKNDDYYSTIGYQFVTPTDINGKYTETTDRKISEIGIKKGRLVPKGSVLVTCIASIGKNTIVNTEASFNQQINAIVVNTEHNNEFVYYNIEKNVDKLKAASGSGTMPILNKSEFSKITLEFPSLVEQQKIADFLSTLDSKISLESQILSTLQTLKKGLLQKMFV